MRRRDILKAAAALPFAGLLAERKAKEAKLESITEEAARRRYVPNERHSYHPFRPDQPFSYQNPNTIQRYK